MATKQQAYKYKYHAHHKWGIKYGGHEVLTAGASEFVATNLLDFRSSTRTASPKRRCTRSWWGLTYLN